MQRVEIAVQILLTGQCPGQVALSSFHACLVVEGFVVSVVPEKGRSPGSGKSREEIKGKGR